MNSRKVLAVSTTQITNMLARRENRQFLKRAYLAAAIVAFLAVPALPRQKTDDLTTRSLQDLMNIKVTSVSKKEQKLSRVAAAVFVITQEDIARSGATNIPDLLRMVPGLDVGEINGSTWAISARGFNGQFSNKLLVMIDGRIVYTPNFAGVYWDTLDLPLEDIDRIEVIRGPGGTIWGANAVNGVISIFTKKASETKGAMVESSAGNLEAGAGTIQYGGTLGTKTDYRVFTKYFDENPIFDITGQQNGADGWHMLRTGFRSDSTLSAKDTMTVEGNLYSGREGEFGYELPSVTSPGLVPIGEQIDMGGGFIQSTWNHISSPRSDFNLQGAFTRYERDDPLEPETRDTFDLDFQNHIAWGARQDIVWGLGYRYTTDRFGSSLTVSFNPPGRALQLFSSFVQDEIALAPDKLYLTVGTKLEHNDYTGFGVMPSARLAWMLGDRSTLWGAVSRALRTPSRNDSNLVVNFASSPGPRGIPILYRLAAELDFHDERLVAYELGYRNMISQRISIDVTAYYNDYDSLQTVEPGAPFFEATPAPPHEVQPFAYENMMYGETHGIEIAADGKLTDRWTLKAGYAFERLHMHLNPTSEDTGTVPFVEGAAPHQSAQLRSHFEIGRGLAWEVSAYFVDRLSDQGYSDRPIPAYTRLDTGLTWRISEGISIGAFGQNLQSDHHLEFEDNFGSMQSGQIKRSAYGKFTWRFRP